MKFGVTLSNRGILLGLTTVPKLLALADAVEACPLLDSVWVGDALFVNQRLDSLTPARRHRRPHQPGASRPQLHGLLRPARPARLRL